MAGRPCSICTHPKRREIDKALIRMKGKRGEGYRAIASRYGVNRSSVQRHFNQHVPKTVKDAEEADEVRHGINILEWIERDRETLENVRGRAENRVSVDAEGTEYEDPDDRMLLEVVRSSAKLAEVTAKVQGDIPSGDGQPIEIVVDVAGEG